MANNVKASGVRQYGFEDPQNIFRAAPVFASLKAKPAENQIEFSLGKLDVLYDGTLDVLQKYETGAMVYSPLGQGKLVSGGSANGLWSKKDKYAASETQLALAWLLSHPVNMFPVIGTSKPERIIESAKPIDVRLERQDWFEMLKIASGKEVP